MGGLRACRVASGISALGISAGRAEPSAAARFNARSNKRDARADGGVDGSWRRTRLRSPASGAGGLRRYRERGVGMTRGGDGCIPNQTKNRSRPRRPALCFALPTSLREAGRKRWSTALAAGCSEGSRRARFCFGASDFAPRSRPPTPQLRHFRPARRRRVGSAPA